ncbi:MAG: hypothetical protein P1U40_00080 [Coxiellaceae bacterium]|nr:hypothetical protein [Coxiellaceae bacterium]
MSRARPQYLSEDSSLSRVLSGINDDLELKTSSIKKRLERNERIRQAKEAGEAEPIVVDLPKIGTVEVISLKDQGVTPGLFWKKVMPEADGSFVRGMIKYAKQGNIKEVVGEQAAMQLATVTMSDRVQIADCFIHPAVVSGDSTVVLISTFNQAMKPMTDFAVNYTDKGNNHGVLTAAGNERSEGLSPVAVTGLADLLFFSYLCQDSDLIGKACQNKGIVDGQLFLFDLVFQTEGPKFIKGPIRINFDTLFDVDPQQLQVTSHYSDGDRARLKKIGDVVRHIQVRNLSVLQHTPIEERVSALLQLRQRIPQMQEVLQQQATHYRLLADNSLTDSPESKVYAEISRNYSNAQTQLFKRTQEINVHFEEVFARADEINAASSPRITRLEKNYDDVRDAGEIEYKEEDGRSYVLREVEIDTPACDVKWDQVIISRMYMLQQLVNQQQYSFYGHDKIKGVVLAAAHKVDDMPLAASVDFSSLLVQPNPADPDKINVMLRIEVEDITKISVVRDNLMRLSKLLGVGESLLYSPAHIAEHKPTFSLTIPQHALLQLSDERLRELMAPETAPITSQRVIEESPYMAVTAVKFFDRMAELAGEMPSVAMTAMAIKQQQYEICCFMKEPVPPPLLPLVNGLAGKALGEECSPNVYVDAVIDYFQLAHELDLNKLATDMMLQEVKAPEKYASSDVVRLRDHMKKITALPFEQRQVAVDSMKKSVVVRQNACRWQASALTSSLVRQDGHGHLGVYDRQQQRVSFSPQHSRSTRRFEGAKPAKLC